MDDLPHLPYLCFMWLDRSCCNTQSHTPCSHEGVAYHWHVLPCCTAPKTTFFCICMPASIARCCSALLHHTHRRHYASCTALKAALKYALQDFFLVSLLAMGGAYFTNWALNYLNYTTRIVFKSSRVLPVMAFRSLVVGAKYSYAQYCAGDCLGGQAFPAPLMPNTSCHNMRPARC